MARKHISLTARFYCAAVAVVFLLGLSPVMLNFVVDPYDMNGVVDLGLEKQKVSEKAHYPLWKVVHFPEGKTDIIVLGDSRARALRDKYWHEVGLTGAYNFAYGGATLSEIYDTFKFAKERANLKAIVIGMQLRSFDPKYKNGMNRVPEALRLTRHPLKYYSNWFVSRIGVKNLERKYDFELSDLGEVSFNFVSPAFAEHMPLEQLRKINSHKTHDDCFDCEIPSIVAPADQKSLAVQTKHYFSDDLGIWKSLWQPIHSDQKLPKKFARQVNKNANATWRSFKFSKKFWARLEEISAWCAQNNVALVFIVPPTIVEMQSRIAEFGYGDLNHKFLSDLAGLGTVVDFDFDSPLTRDIDRFTDAYHFNSKVARLMVGEIAQVISPATETKRLVGKRRKDVICPTSKGEITAQITDDRLQVISGRSCRIWRKINE